MGSSLTAVAFDQLEVGNVLPFFKGKDETKWAVIVLYQTQKIEKLNLKVNNHTALKARRSLNELS
ncbi:hypothetical protein, partial [Shewanella colwelliana]|uniref:hypothetical protein n=1 Tax=Shewanella colwelliana TaxID=23 RepID=UPI001C7D03AC